MIKQAGNVPDHWYQRYPKGSNDWPDERCLHCAMSHGDRPLQALKDTSKFKTVSSQSRIK